MICPLFSLGCIYIISFGVNDIKSMNRVLLDCPLCVHGIKSKACHTGYSRTKVIYISVIHVKIRL